MARKLAAVVVRDDNIPEGLVEQHLLPDAEVEITEFAGTLESVTTGIRGIDADVLLITATPSAERILDLIPWWRSARPGRPVLLLSVDPMGAGQTDPSLVSRAFVAGADDVIVIDPGPQVSEHARRELDFGLRKAVARNLLVSDRAPDAGTLIGVLGPKGGTGKTLTSTNLAVALAQRGRRTALVDIDLQFGDVALSLGLNLDRTVFDLAVSGGSLDGEKLDDFMLRHPTGLRVLAAPGRPDQAASVTPDMLTDVFRLLRSEYDFVVVDTPPYFSSEVIATIDASTHVAMLGMLDALSLKNTRLGIETLDLMGYDQSRVTVVLNRANSVVGISETDVVAILGRVPDVLVPSSRDVVRSVNDGEPVVVSQRRSDMATAFERLADLYVRQPESALPGGSGPATPAELGAKPERRRAFSLRRRQKSVPATAGVSTGETSDGAA